MRLAATLAIALSLIPAAAAQAPRPSVARATAAPITGRVLAADTSEPIGYARLAVVSQSDGVRTSLRSDRQGAFSLSALPVSALPASAPSARPRITVSKAGYAPAEVIADAGAVLEIRLARAAVIAGRASDERGDPIVGARVSIEVKDDAGLLAVVTTATDDRGDYRAGALPAGRYAVAIATAGMRTVVQGNGFFSMSTPGKTYYPGAESVADARLLDVAAGDVRSDVDFVLPAGAATSRTIAETLRFVPMRPVGLTDILASAAAPMSQLHGGRDAAPGSAVVRGRVTSTDGRPVPNAQVTLLNDAQWTDQVEATADGDGRFEFAALRPAAYRVQAAKPGYSTLPAAPVGLVSSALLNALPKVAVAAGDSRDGVEVRLVPWGAVTGRLLDEFDDPVQGARVQLFRVRFQSGRRGLVPTGAATLTNDLGIYRVYGVPPGDYIVGAAVGDVGTASIPGYVRSYFPGTAVVAESRPVAVAPGEDVGGVDFALVPGRTALIAGRLLDAQGQPTTGGSVQLLPSAAASATIGLAVGARTYPDGRFEFANVPAGRYVIQVSRGRPASWIEGQFGAWPVVVGDRDITGLVLQMSAGSGVLGRVVFAGLSRVAPSLPAGIEITPVAVDVDQSPVGPATALIRPDGSFRVEGLSGPRRLEVQRLPRGWALQQIVAAGVDITDRPLPFGRLNQSLIDVEVILTDRITEIDGHVIDDRGRKAAGANVVLYPVDRSRWYPSSRFLRMAATANDGGFTVDGLPFGAYYAAAPATVPEGDGAWQDPEFLDALTASAKVVVLVEGQRIALELPLLRDVRVPR